MPIDLPERARDDIVPSARGCGIRDFILFRSRAAGRNRAKSDIDLAVRGRDTRRFLLELDESARTLPFFCIVDLDGTMQPELTRSMLRGGVVLCGQL